MPKSRQIKQKEEMRNSRFLTWCAFRGIDPSDMAHRTRSVRRSLSGNVYTVGYDVDYSHGMCDVTHNAIDWAAINCLNDCWNLNITVR